jgi:hypothetical protein
MQIAFTGVRRLTKSQEDLIYKHFTDISTYEAQWHVGDAPGLDALVRKFAADYHKTPTVYEVQGYQKWHFAARSKRMVDAIANLPDPWLYAFPNKLCPDGCKPCKSPNGNGSGTWLTIAYAHYRGVQIQIFPLETITFPKWLEVPQNKQLKLF